MTISPASRDKAVHNVALLILRVLTAAGLVVDAIVHLRLAGDYDRVGEQITVGTLFRVESAVAVVAAIAVLVSCHWLASLSAGIVAASAVGGLLLSVYWQVGAIGPFPDLYEPIWFAEKKLALLAESTSALAALGIVVLAAPWRRS
jgi:hypothetical protein